MNEVNILRKQANDFASITNQANILFLNLVEQIENGLPAEIPMQLNELPTRQIITVSRPYVVDIQSLATGDEYDVVTDYAKECMDFFKPNDNRVLGTHKFRLANFGQNKSSEEIAAWSLQNGMYLPPMLYANDFAKAHPEIQRSIPVVSLGEPNKPFVDRNGYRRALVLRSDDGKRKLFTNNWDGDWCGLYWFLLCELPLWRLDS
jgi:hypothetical protein